MKRPETARIVFAALVAVLAVAPAGGKERSFIIATGPQAGTYSAFGKRVAEIVSRPPDLTVTARTSDGGAANLLAVNAGRADSGLAQSYLVADAVAGRSVFRGAGRLTHIRVIAGLFPETLQLVAATRAGVATIGELRGKRVSLGPDRSGTGALAESVLSAYGFGERSLTLRHDTSAASADALRRGRLDAFFFLGTAPSPLVARLIARGAARLVPIEGKARRHLLLRVPSLSADAISAGTYPGTGTIQTVACWTLWVVRDTAPPGLVYGLARALFDPANRARLDAGGHAARYISLDQATSGLTAPLHPGAERYYREMGKLAAGGPK